MMIAGADSPGHHCQALLLLTPPLLQGQCHFGLGSGLDARACSTAVCSVLTFWMRLPSSERLGTASDGYGGWLLTVARGAAQHTRSEAALGMQSEQLSIAWQQQQAGTLLTLVQHYPPVHVLQACCACCVRRECGCSPQWPYICVSRGCRQYHVALRVSGHTSSLTLMLL